MSALFARPVPISVQRQIRADAERVGRNAMTMLAEVGRSRGEQAAGAVTAADTVRQRLMAVEVRGYGLER